MIKIRWSIFFALFFFTGALKAAVINITADFTPDFNNPEKNTFKNTTPIGGFCSTWTSYCKRFGLDFSISWPISTKRSKPIFASNKPRDGVYFDFPKKTTVSVVNQYGEKREVIFDITAFNARFSKNYESNSWDRGSFQWTGRGGCGSTQMAVSNGWGFYAFAWYYHGGACYKSSTIDRTEPDNASDFYDQSLAYELITPDPLAMGSGTYKGQLRWTVGPGGDVDYGDNYIASDTEITINFALSVNHELKVKPIAGATDVTLYPCYHNSSCSKEENDKNWERLIITNIPPQKLSGISRFNISSSGGFTVYMECGSGTPITKESCPLKSDKPDSLYAVPVKALITLPDNVTTLVGGKVKNKPLFVGKDNAINHFRSASFGIDKAGQVEFYIEKKDVSEMLKSRPDNWSGSVTLIFDPNLY